MSCRSCFADIDADFLTCCCHGKSMWCDEVGPSGAQTVLFLHGAGISGWMWQRQVRDLSPHFHCLIPDLPGHGKSNRMPWCNLDEVVGDVQRLIAQRAHGGQAHLVGLSLGAHVAMRLASTCPSCVNHAVVSGFNVLPFPHRHWIRLRWFLLVPFSRLEFVRRSTAKQLHIPPEAHFGYAEAARQTSWQAMLRIGNEILDRGASAMPHGVKCPTLLVAGEREHPLVLQSMPLVARAIPGAQAYLVPRVGHGWNGEAPDLFSRMVSDWIQDKALPDELEPVLVGP